MINEIIEDMKDRGHKTIDTVKREFAHIRTGRANPSVLDDVRVEAYGQLMPINQLANMAVPEPRQITISPWDLSTAGAVEKAIQKANLGVGVNFDGKILRVNFPELTEERRKEFVKLAHARAEEGRVAIRNIRRDANEHLKSMLKEHEISEDDEKKALDTIQKLTDDAIEQINHLLNAKEKEIMEV